ncbi:tail assembly protein [Limnobaculum zhutongyuii]|uniref:Tail assembly protein n=1 Tax=Limnobaculum zhutongyuii TaxID=2498113 RepID=A0A411WLW4_9GAMM|nr:tail assembly protein [Limnobaculum zhutongyuii]QBH97150.1 tail assembly protein [Limnobaculum zhutongyuii]TQS88409.1 tail assembly protein [Limnobaculum zhutongyuii]
MAIVRFYGDLQRYGRKFNLNVVNAAEAIRALALQIPGLRQHIQGDYYRVRIAGNDINESGLQYGMLTVLKENDVIHIIPRSVGSKSGIGIFQAVAGVALMVASIWLGPAAFGAGLGLLMGGVATMLTKTPKTKKAEEGATNNNTSFSSLDNTVAQGQPVPLCYGRMMIGSKVLSQGLSTE